MLGQLFLVRKQIQLKRFVLRGGRAARACACDRANGDFFAKDTHQNFRARADDLKTAEVKEEHKR